MLWDFHLNGQSNKVGNRLPQLCFLKSGKIWEIPTMSYLDLSWNLCWSKSTTHGVFLEKKKRNGKMDVLREKGFLKGIYFRGLFWISRLFRKKLTRLKIESCHLDGRFFHILSPGWESFALNNNNKEAFRPLSCFVNINNITSAIDILKRFRFSLLCNPVVNCHFLRIYHEQKRQTWTSASSRARTTRVTRSNPNVSSTTWWNAER